MIYNKNFDVDSILRCVELVNGNFPEGTTEDEALRICAAALLFVRDEAQKLEEFREYFRKINTSALEGIKVSHTFATRQEADEWLAGGTAIDGEHVRVAGQGFQVFDRGAKGVRLIRIPLPEELPPHKPR